MNNVIELKPSTIAKLDLGPDDILVVHSSVDVSYEQGQHLLDSIKTYVPNRVMLLTPNLSLEVIKK